MEENKNQDTEQQKVKQEVQQEQNNEPPKFRKKILNSYQFNVIALVLLLFIVVTVAELFRGTNENSNSTDGDINADNNSVAIEKEVSLLAPDESLPIDADEFKEVMDKVVACKEKDHSYRRAVSIDMNAPQESASVVITNEGEGGDQIEYIKVAMPDEYLRLASTLGQFSLREKGMVSYDEDGIFTYNQSAIFNSEAGDNAAPEVMSEYSYKNGVKRILLNSNARNSLKPRKDDTGYEGQGLPELEIYETMLINILSPEKYYKFAKDSGYLVKAFKDSTSSNYNLIFDNSKLIDFMISATEEINSSKNLMDKMVDELNKYGFSLEDKVAKKYLALTTPVYDYKMTESNLFQDFVRFTVMNNFDKEKKSANRRKFHLMKDIKDNLSENFKGDLDNTYTIKSYIIGTVDNVVNGKKEIGKEPVLKHELISRVYTDYLKINDVRTYIDLDISPDKESLEYDYKYYSERKIKNTTNPMTSTMSNGTTGSVFILLQSFGNSELTLADVCNKMNKISKKEACVSIPSIQELYKPEDPYKTLKDGDYKGIDSADAIKREHKIDSIMYWINQYVRWANLIQDTQSPNEMANAYTNLHEMNKSFNPKDEERLKSPKYFILKPNVYSLGNIVPKEVMDKINNPEETDDENSENTNEDENNDSASNTEENELLIDMGTNNINLNKLLKKGYYKELSTGDGYSDILFNLFGKDIYGFKTNSGTLGDLVKDKNKPTILFLGEHWCPYCRATLKVFNDKEDLFNDFNFIMMTESTKADFDEDEEKDQYSNIVEHTIFQDSSISIDIGINYLPTIVITDKDGKLISVSHAVTDDVLYEEFVKEIKSIIKELN